MGVIVNGRRVDGETLEAWPAQAVLPADVNAQDEKIFEPCIWVVPIPTDSPGTCTCNLLATKAVCDWLDFTISLCLSRVGHI